MIRWRKLENADIKSKEEKDSFANSLNNLLNDKYLEIVKIKRIDFFNPAGVNENIEEAIDGFVNYLNGAATFNQESLNTLINDYKSKIYKQVKSALEKISNLYLNNFVSEVSSSLNDNFSIDIPTIPEVTDVKPVTPIEIKEEPSKRPYDVEEILKIAKSPIVSMPEMKKEEPISTKDEYVPVSPITEEKETETMESEFNEKEIVEVMIRRLTNRLNDINERTSKYESEKEKLEEDESFVNDLIKSSNDKKTNYLIISFIIMFFINIAINVSMNLGTFPIIGITLPFLSYGGSSLLFYFIFIGLIFSLVNKDT